MTLSASFQARLNAAARRVETLLASRLGDAPRTGEIARPERLVAAMRHAVLGGGKRLRPFLTMETARLLKGDPKQALRAGAAIELLHCYSLVHDDLPAMDDDDLRRGRPTVHRAFDEATAILVGDGLQTLAFELMAEPATHPDGEVRAQLVLGLARASGLGGMAGGQMLDLAAEGRYGAPTTGPDEVRLLQAMKTGALIAFSVEAGGIVAGAEAATRQRLRAFGKALGAAFQIADDILDREATPEELGKATAKDAAAGKATLVDLIGLEAAREERDGLVRKAMTQLRPFGTQGEILREVAQFVGQRRS
jgi:farnesyl diphosphate synthase